MGVSGITEITSLVLSNTFPMMSQFEDDPKDVIFDIDVKKVQFNFSEEKGAVILGNGQVTVSTDDIKYSLP